jgi:hypothetical protein
VTAPQPGDASGFVASQAKVTLQRNALPLALSSIAVAALGACGTLALVLPRIVVPQALWVVSPYLALVVIGFSCRKEAAAGAAPLAGTALLAAGGLLIFLVEERVRASTCVPAFLWGGCAVPLGFLLVRRLPRPRR